MNAKSKQAVKADAKQKAKVKFLQKIAARWRTFVLCVPRREMMQVLPKHVQKKILAKLAENGEPVAGVDFRIGLFGPKQKEYYDHCRAPGAKLGNDIRKETQKTGKDGEYMISEERLRNDFQAWKDRADECNEQRRDWVKTEFHDAEAQGKAAINHNFPFRFKDPATGKLVRPSYYLNYPEFDEFLNTPGISLGFPRRMSVETEDDFGMFDAATAAEYAADSAAELEVQFEAAKVAVIEDAQRFMKRVDDQLVPGKRLVLHKTLIEEARLVVAQLREITEGYKPDRRLTAIAKTIEDKIARFDDPEVFRSSETARLAAHGAAVSIQKKLSEVLNPTAPVAKPKAKKAAPKPAPNGKGRTARGLVGRVQQAASNQ